VRTTFLSSSFSIFSVSVLIGTTKGSRDCRTKSSKKLPMSKKKHQLRKKQNAYVLYIQLGTRWYIAVQITSQPKASEHTDFMPTRKV
jgi:hypothetical protein